MMFEYNGRTHEILKPKMASMLINYSKC